MARKSIPPRPTPPDIAHGITEALRRGDAKAGAKMAIENDRVFEFISGEFEPEKSTCHPSVAKKMNIV